MEDAAVNTVQTLAVKWPHRLARIPRKRVLFGAMRALSAVTSRARMACKFHAAMTTHRLHSRDTRRRALGALAAAAWVALAGLPAHAEQADRSKPMIIEADQTGTLDLQKQTLVATGNVVVSKGTMKIRADRIEVHQTPAGYDIATAYGTPGHPATFRQKREGVDEYITGEADRLEYNGVKDTVRFVGNAAVRRLRGATLADEITGNLVTYDGTTEVFRVSGGATPSASNPGGRVRAVLTPRPGSEAAKEAAQAASSAPKPALELSPRLSSPAPASAPSGGKR